MTKVSAQTFARGYKKRIQLGKTLYRFADFINRNYITLILKTMILTALVNSVTDMQKQPPGGVPRKRCSENMQQIYRRTPMPSVLLLICCIFSEHLFVRTPLGGCFWTWKFSQYRSNHWRCSWNLNQSFAKFTGKHLCQCLFFNKVGGLRPVG